MGAILDFDEAVLRAINNLAGRSPSLDLLMIAVTALGISLVLALVSVPLWLRGRRELAIDVLIAIGLCLVVEVGLKVVIARDRPFAVLDDLHHVQIHFLDTASGHSFPSGHATRAFALASLLWLALSTRWRHVLLVFAVMIAFSRVYLGLHWPTDVIGGALLGVGVAWLILVIGRGEGFYVKFRGGLVKAFSRPSTNRQTSERALGRAVRLGIPTEG